MTGLLDIFTESSRPEVIPTTGQSPGCWEGTIVGRLTHPRQRIVRVDQRTLVVLGCSFAEKLAPAGGAYAAGAGAVGVPPAPTTVLARSSRCCRKLMRVVSPSFSSNHALPTGVGAAERADGSGERRVAVINAWVCRRVADVLARTHTVRPSALATDLPAPPSRVRKICQRLVTDQSPWVKIMWSCFGRILQHREKLLGPHLQRERRTVQVRSACQPRSREFPDAGALALTLPGDSSSVETDAREKP